MDRLLNPVDIESEFEVSADINVFTILTGTIPTTLRLRREVIDYVGRRGCDLDLEHLGVLVLSE